MYIKIEYATSPTVSLGVIMINSAIESHEEIDVATISITGTYLNIELDEEVIIIPKGRLE